MSIAEFSKTWHSPTNVLFHLDELSKNLEDPEALESSPHYQKPREARTAAILAFVLSKQNNRATFIRLPKTDPPDAYLFQNDNGKMAVAPIELTSHYPSGQSLLEKLKEKKLKQQYPKELILVIELFTEDGVDYEAISQYAKDQKIEFRIWTLRKVQQKPNTIAEVVIIHPRISKFLVDIGEAAHNFKEKYNAPPIVFTQKTSHSKGTRTERMIEPYTTHPWENLQD
jgi:hypothetical protein